MKSILTGLFILFLLSNEYTFSQSLKLMTYNIRLDVAVDGENDWAHRKDFLTSQIKFYEPDILGIQEARPNQVTDMDSLLPLYQHIGIGREGIGKGESSNIYFRKDRFTLMDSKTFWLSETPDSISKGWDAAYNRVCTYGLFKDKKTNKMIWVFNTHLDHIGEVARTKGIQLILSKIALVNKRKYPVVFMGDFNTEPDADRIIALNKVMDDCKSRSVAKAFGPEGTFNNFRHDQPVAKLIDYIYISKSTKIIVKKYAVLSDAKELRYPSDHLPVFVELFY